MAKISCIWKEDINSQIQESKGTPNTINPQRCIPGDMKSNFYKLKTKQKS